MDHDRDDPAVLGALKDEKNPAVRGYLAGLIRQVGAICERHGAKAADLGKKEAQERLPTGELSTVRKLVAKILEIRKGNLDIGSKREIVAGLDERESAARNLMEMLIRHVALDHDSTEFLVTAYLRAQLPSEARKIIESPTSKSEVTLQANISLAEALELSKTDPPAAKEILSREFLSSVRNAPDSWNDRTRLYLTALDARLSLLTDMEVDELLGELKAAKPEFTSVLEIERLVVEQFARLGKQPTKDDFRNATLRSREFYKMSDRERVESILLRLEMRQSHGIDGHDLFDRAIAFAQKGGFEENTMVKAIARTAGVVGALDVAETLFTMTKESHSLMGAEYHRSWMNAAEGCIRAKRFDTALEILRDPFRIPGPNKPDVASILAVALLNDDQVQQATDVYAEWFQTVDNLVRSREYDAALARGGTDVLSAVEPMIHRLEGPEDLTTALSVANAAIATIGYTVAMRKKFSEYVPKP